MFCFNPPQKLIDILSSSKSGKLKSPSLQKYRRLANAFLDAAKMLEDEKTKKDLEETLVILEQLCQGLKCGRRKSSSTQGEQ